MRLLLLAFCLLPATAHAAPCEGERGDPWYVTRLQVNTPALPYGVEMEGRLTKDQQPALVLTNRGDIPLRVGAHELASGKTIVLTGEELEELMDVKVAQAYGDGRPANHQPPTGQRFMLVGSQGGNRVLLPGAVEILLNPKYRPRAAADGRAACERRSNVYLVIGILVLLGVVGVVVFRTLKG